MTKTIKIWFDHGTADLTFSLAKQTYIEIDGKEQPWGQVYRLAVAPGDFDAVMNFVDNHDALDDDGGHEGVEVRGAKNGTNIENATGGANIMALDASIDMQAAHAHPFTELFKGLWTDEVVEAWERKCGVVKDIHA